MGTRNRVAVNVGCCWTLCRTPNSATWKESFGTVRTWRLGRVRTHDAGQVNQQLSLNSRPHAPSPPRQPLLSRLMIFLLHLMAAILQIFIQPLGREIEPAVSLLVTGSFFGLAAWSVFFYWVVLKACEHAVSVLGITDINLGHYVGLPLLAVPVAAM